MADRASVTFVDGDAVTIANRRQGIPVFRLGEGTTYTVIPATPTPARTAGGAPAGKTIARIAADCGVHFAIGSSSVVADANDPIIGIYTSMEYVEVEAGQYVSFLKIV